MSTFWKCVIAAVICLGITACATTSGPKPKPGPDYSIEIQLHVIEPCTTQAILDYAERTGMSVEGAQKVLFLPLLELTLPNAYSLKLRVSGLSRSDRQVVYKQALQDCIRRASWIR